MYDDYLKAAPLIKILLLKDVKEFSMAVTSSFEIFSLNSPLNRGVNDAPSGAIPVSAQTNNVRKPLKRYNGLQRSTVTLTNSGILIGSTEFKTETIEIAAENDGEIEINNVNYWGTIEIIPQVNGTFLVIEETDVERFLSGVLGSEMPLSWEKNTLFAQVVAARTFAVYQKKKHNSGIYHINRLDLAYEGRLSEDKKARELVNKSKGIIMVYNWQIFPGYFHSTCGGHTEDVYHVFRERSIPPLAGVSCGYCESSKYFRWQTDVKKEDIEKKLNGLNKKTGSFVSIKPVDLGTGDHASTIEILSSTKTERIDANAFRLLIGSNKLYSTAFTVQNNGKDLQLYGKGWGHGVGLCQYGSQKMSLLGFKWYEILKHYYPGIDLVKIY